MDDPRIRRRPGRGYDSPDVGMFFAFRRLTPHEFFGIAFFLGFTITFLGAEAWVDYTRQQTSAGSRMDAARSWVA